MIEKALAIDKSLPRVAPDGAKCLLGKMITIPDTERSLEDLKEEALLKERISGGDYTLWWECTHNWLTSIPKLEREIIKMRCMNHMAWKRIALKVKETGLHDRVLCRDYLYDIFLRGLDQIIYRFFR